MTPNSGAVGPTHGRSEAWRLGAATTAALGIVLLGWALSMDFVKASSGFFGDGATYYELAHSLADDFDFEYRRDDLVRVWREFPSGPEGIFLKRGRDVDVAVERRRSRSCTWTRARTPTPRASTSASRSSSRCSPRRSCSLFGTNGFLVLHAVLMTCCFLCAYAFLVARSHPVPSLIFAFAFLFVSVTPVYIVQIMPDFFNLAMVLFGYFFWCYKEVVGPDAPGRSRPLRVRWLLSPRSDVIAAIFLGLATFSKPTHVMLIMPLLVSALLRSQWRADAS